MHCNNFIMETCVILSEKYILLHLNFVSDHAKNIIHNRVVSFNTYDIVGYGNNILNFRLNSRNFMKGIEDNVLKT